MLSEITRSIGRWFDSSIEIGDANDDGIDWVRVVPFVVLHVACIGIFWAGWSWAALGLALASYLIRMFAITAFYHRYFSHRTFKTNRIVQTVFAFIANASAQRGPLWWASHHRAHHIHADEEPDEHSPRWKGFIRSHVGWFLTKRNFSTDQSRVGDWKKYPELRFLDRFDVLAPIVYFAFSYLVGEALALWAPGLGTNGFQTLMWVGVLSTLAVMHATFCINSLAHGKGSKRFETDDESRNSFLLSILTLGEGWHNNHHRYPVACRQGFYWWEIDPTLWALKAMEGVGLVRELNPVPQSIYDEANKSTNNDAARQSAYASSD